MGNGVARVSPDPLDRPRITRSKSDGLRPHSIGRTSRRTPRVHGRTRPLFIGQTSLALPRVNRTDSHSESPRPLSHGRISPALGRPTPIQPFPNPDMDGINRHSTTNQPSFVSNPRTIPTQPSHMRDPPTPTQPCAKGFVRRWPKAPPRGTLGEYAVSPRSNLRSTASSLAASPSLHLINCEIVELRITQ